MGANASQVKYTQDKHASVLLRNGTDSPELITAFESPGKSLNELRAAYWHNKEIPHGKFAVVFDVQALDTSGDATYDLSLIVDDVSLMNDTPKTVGGPLRITAIGIYEIVVDSAVIPGLDPDASGTDKWISPQVTIGGSTGKSIDYECWVAKSFGA